MPMLVINPSTKKHLEAVVKKLPQSLLLSGPSRVGLTAIAKYIAEEHGVAPVIILPEKDDKVDLHKGVIGVEVMRQVSSELTTKTDRDRIVIIDYAETMTTQAQNAFLKLLEEPGQNIHFILVSKSAGKLLPTILSRTERINIKPVSAKQSEKLLDDLGINDQVKRSQIMFIASGLPAEIKKLSIDEEYFSTRTASVRDARDFLQGRLYKRLLIVHKYKDDRQLAIRLLDDAAKILSRSLLANPSDATIDLTDKLVKAQERIEANGNIRICLSQILL